MTERARSFIVAAEDAGRRLDHLVRERFPELTRRVLNDLFRADRVTVDGRPAAKGTRATEAACVGVELPPPDRALGNPSLALTIAAEGDGWVVIEKPAGVPSAVRDGRDLLSVANALIARYPDMAGFGHHPREAGLVHRLDTATSGLLLAATTPAAFAELVAALRRGGLHKRYLALAPDVPHAQGRIRSRIEAGRGPRVVVTELSHESEMAVARAEGDGARAIEYRVLERRGRVALLEVTVSIAYRHQIRAQLAAIGCPILGDTRYGSSSPLPRHALHASWLGYRGGSEVGAFELESRLPEDLQAIWNGLPDPAS